MTKFFNRFLVLFACVSIATCLGCSDPVTDSDADSDAKQSEHDHDDHDHDHDDDDHDHDGHDHDGHDHGDHDGHDHGDEDGHEDTQATFSESVENIAKLQVVICKAFNAGTPEDAHDDLHSIGHALGKLPDLAADHDLSPEQVKSVETCANNLLDYFTELDGTLHSDEEINLKELEKKITEGIAELKGLNQ